MEPLVLFVNILDYRIDNFPAKNIVPSTLDPLHYGDCVLRSSSLISPQANERSNFYLPIELLTDMCGQISTRKLEGWPWVRRDPLFSTPLGRARSTQGRLT
jgi:hypothetical protein